MTASFVRGMFVVAIFAPMAIFSLMFSISEIATFRSPMTALRLNDKNGEAAAYLADLEVAKNAEKLPSKNSLSLARSGLTHEPLNTRALRILAMEKLARNQREEGINLLLLSDSVSRRDALTQLMLVTNASSESQGQAIMKRLDTAMRTAPKSWSVLFPLLLSAIQRGELWEEAGKYLKMNPNWLLPFLDSAISTDDGSSSIAEWIIKEQGLENSPDEYAIPFTNKLLGRLIQIGQFDTARRYYLQLEGSSPSQLKSTAFNQSTINANHSPMTWQLTNDGYMSARFVKYNAAGELALMFEALPETNAVAIVKHLYLPPSRYSFQGPIKYNVKSAESNITWYLECEADRGRFTIWSEEAKSQAYKSVITIPPDCPHQRLQLKVVSGSDQAGIEGRIMAISIRPLS